MTTSFPIELSINEWKFILLNQQELIKYLLLSNPITELTLKLEKLYCRRLATSCKWLTKWEENSLKALQTLWTNTKIPQMLIFRSDPLETKLRTSQWGNCHCYQVYIYPAELGLHIGWEVTLSSQQHKNTILS